MGERRWKTSGSSKLRVAFGIFNVLLIVSESPYLLVVSVNYSYQALLSDCIKLSFEGVRCTHSTTFIIFIPSLGTGSFSP